MYIKVSSHPFRHSSETHPFPSKTLGPTVGPLQHKDHYTQPRRPLPLRSLLEAAAAAGIHQRLALPQVVGGVAHLKLRMYQAGDKTIHWAKFSVSYPSAYVQGM